MKNTRNKRRLAEIQDNFEEDNSQSSSRERSQADLNENYITQVSQEIEGRIAKKLSQEFSKRESRILGALAKLDNFLSNPPSGNGASTPKLKLTSVQDGFEARSSNMPERDAEGQTTLVVISLPICCMILLATMNVGKVHSCHHRGTLSSNTTSEPPVPFGPRAFITHVVI